MEELDPIHVYETELATFWFDENGILCALSKDTPRTLKRQQDTYELIRHISNNRKVCLYSNMTTSSLVMQDDITREYIAREMPLLFKAMAMLVQSTLDKVAPTIFVNTMNEPIPMKTFSVEAEAKEWLKQYL